MTDKTEDNGTITHYFTDMGPEAEVRVYVPAGEELLPDFLPSRAVAYQILSDLVPKPVQLAGYTLHFGNESVGKVWIPTDFLESFEDACIEKADQQDR